MKKRITILTALFLTAVALLPQAAKAQAPQKMSYQTVIRDASNVLISDTTVGIQISILQGAASGAAVFVETHTPTTNANGLASLEIGTGTPVTGTIVGIDWAAGPYFIKTETDPLGGTAYSIVGTSQLMSVPYALFSANGTPGPVGPTGLTGATGATGATGLLSSGTAAGNTAYWNGSNWILNGANFYNNGSNIGIGTTTPNASAIAEMNSSTQGFLPPRMTTVQRDAILSPAAGLTIYNTTVNCLQWWNGTIWYDGCGNNIPSAALSTLNCVGATTTGTLTNGTAASGVSITIPYTGGNGGTYAAQAISSTGVLGLTANLSAGTLAVGAGNLLYTITGTPTTSGTASFAITVGGQSCSFTLSVATGSGLYPAGTVNCAGATAVLDVTNPTTGKIWMDRNLGASQVAISSTDAASYGDLYQWGRRADGHQCRTSATTATLSSIDQPANGNFILAASTPYDWRSPQNNSLWQGVSGVNNPCPSGYRIPSDTELDLERLSWGSNNSAGAFASPLKLPMAGYRDYSSGSLDFVGTLGYYWSSTVSGIGSRSLSLDSSNADMYDDLRAYGVTVRCIKD
jgi:Fibrobacter succinogenes major domain (Fib_succ_major)